MIFFLGIIKKMNNQIEYIPSGGVGEIYLDMIDGHWYMCESTKYAKEKVLPFLSFYMIYFE